MITKTAAFYPTTFPCLTKPVAVMTQAGSTEHMLTNDLNAIIDVHRLECVTFCYFVSLFLADNANFLCWIIDWRIKISPE